MIRNTFSAKRAVKTILIFPMAFFLIACPGSEDDPDLETDAENVRYNERVYDFDFGLLQDQRKLDNHARATFGITDGSYFPYLQPVGNFLLTFYGMQDENIEVSVDLFAPTESTKLIAGTYEFTDKGTDENALGMADVFFFKDGYVGVDTDGDGITEAEHVAIAGGTVELTGTFPDFTATYDLMTENGNAVVGTYNGVILDSDEFKAE